MLQSKPDSSDGLPLETGCPSSPVLFQLSLLLFLKARATRKIKRNLQHKEELCTCLKTQHIVKLELTMKTNPQLMLLHIMYGHYILLLYYIIRQNIFTFNILDITFGRNSFSSHGVVKHTRTHLYMLTCANVSMYVHTFSHIAPALNDSLQ